MLNYKCVFVTLSLLCLQLGSSATGVCTRTATEQDGYTEEYCCPGYSGNPPNCTRLCADINPPSNGNVSVTTYEAGSIAVYTCDSGFELLGIQSRTCLANGTWSGLKPTCNYTILCPYLDPPGNGSVFVSKYGDQLGYVWYACDSGYRLSGSSHRACQPSGNWSGTQPSCIRSCGHLRLVHGYISVTMYDVGGSATYDCQGGYFLSGPSTRTCLPNGSWSGSEPTCNHTVVCPNLDDPSNGSVSVESTFYGGRAYYSCNPGYRLSGLTYRTCQLSGRWTGIPPVCIRTCSYLSSPRYGHVSVTTRDVGAQGRATYTCNSGFRLVGSPTRTCLSNGSWSGAEPVCNYTLSVFCPDLDPPSNGAVSVKSNFVGGRAYYYCNYGYRRFGYSSRTCQFSGTWSRTQPTCIRLCSYLSSPRYGRVSVTTRDVGGRATYTCNSGFRLIGLSTRTCLLDGSWSGSQPTCIRICYYLSSPSNGFIYVNTRDVGGKANYTCNSGCRLVGSSKRICLSSGIWSGSQPICNCTGSTSYNIVGVTVGVSVGGVIFVTIAVILCVFCCSVCVAKSSSSARTVRATPPTRTPNRIDYTTTQPTYPLQQLYSAAPQLPPTAYPAAQADPKEPTNPEFSSEAPPSYTHACNFPNHPPPAYVYQPTDPKSG